MESADKGITQPASTTESTPSQQEYLSITDKFPGFNILKDQVKSAVPLTQVPNTGQVYCTVCTIGLNEVSDRAYISNHYNENIEGLIFHSGYILVQGIDSDYELYRTLGTNNGPTERFEFQVANDVTFDMVFITIFTDSNGEYHIFRGLISSLSVKTTTYTSVNQEYFAIAVSLDTVTLQQLL